ncbi:hypothetical protein DIURU_000117 [Diutina rugosa]|uniref:Putative lipoate-protein ligase A n=1 Tax=Diutina rugosa TaxID=5481 RepID=A0A642UZM2_DIURU|nr:uncharacterized protein DIURU_000117 [Diutina rugosa]KAA8908574.1 hypothetical protein DIURU_000117 [Diutina rugosa]
MLASSRRLTVPLAQTTRSIHFRAANANLLSGLGATSALLQELGDDEPSSAIPAKPPSPPQQQLQTEIEQARQLRQQLQQQVDQLKKHNQQFSEVLVRLNEIANTTNVSIPNPHDIERTTESVEEAVVEPFPFEAITSETPTVVVSRHHDPFINLALEDYIYHNMPPSSKRLVFYVNSPCVVIGKNQNPWKEVNMPALNRLGVTLVRRNSGGGTVVHDQGNINFSFMTSKQEFDRMFFAELVANAMNRLHQGVKVNDRGDIVTKADNLKVSGSAYKISKGRSYHHGTMLLNSNLEVLRGVLARDPSLGIIETQSIDSVKSPVTNTHVDRERFIDEVIIEFERHFGSEAKVDDEMQSAIDQNDMMGLGDFYEANSKHCDTITISKATDIPPEVLEIAKKLKDDSWRLGHTPKFTHTLTNEKLGFSLKFDVAKGAIVDNMELTFTNTKGPVSKQTIESSVEFLRDRIQQGGLHYKGSDIAGFITNDMISDWVGQSIDGTI